MNRKHVLLTFLIDGTVLLQKRITEMNDSEPITASKGWFCRFRNMCGLKNMKITKETESPVEAVTLPAELKKLIEDRYYLQFQTSTGDVPQ